MTPGRWIRYRVKYGDGYWSLWHRAETRDRTFCGRKRLAIDRLKMRRTKPPYLICKSCRKFADRDGAKPRVAASEITSTPKEGAETPSAAATHPHIGENRTKNFLNFRR